MSNESQVEFTPLHSLHQEHQAKMTNFAGYHMPVNYALGILKEHQHCRNAAALFDVSHMGQIMVTGKDIASQLETVLPVDLESLPVGRQKYALLLNQDGGIIDDLMVIKQDDHYVLVVNAARKDVDFEYLHAQLGDSLTFELLPHALIALQGPKSADVLAQYNDAIHNMRFMDAQYMDLDGINCLISRSGYTGEDGFELSVNADDVVSFTEKLLQSPSVELAGLGARDSLRLEAGLPLYGHELSLETTPLQANLKWAISPVRRPGGKREGNFAGAKTVLDEFNNGVTRLLVGLMPQGKAPIRDGAKIFTEDAQEVGIVTSGTFSPTLEKPIAMGYVSYHLTDTGTALFAEVRNKKLPLTVTKLPFVAHNYVR